MDFPEPQTELVKDFLFMFDLQCLLLATLIQCDKCRGLKTIRLSLSSCLCAEQKNHGPDGLALVQRLLLTLNKNVFRQGDILQWL